MLNGLDNKADRFIDTGKQRNVTGGAVTDPDSAFTAGDFSFAESKIDHQIMFRRTDTGSCFQNSLAVKCFPKSGNILTETVILCGIYKPALGPVVCHFSSLLLSKRFGQLFVLSDSVNGWFIYMQERMNLFLICLCWQKGYASKFYKGTQKNKMLFFCMIVVKFVQDFVAQTRACLL